MDLLVPNSVSNVHLIVLKSQSMYLEILFIQQIVASVKVPSILESFLIKEENLKYKLKKDRNNIRSPIKME